MEETQRKIRKPTGVFVMCAAIFLHFGIYQLINDVAAMKNSEVENPFIIALLLISLDVFCAATVIWAFLGDNYGRISLLISVSLNMLWSVFVLIMMIANAKPKANGFYDANIFLFGFSLLKPLVIFGLCLWYFTQREIIAYYKQDNNYEFF